MTTSTIIINLKLCGVKGSSPGDGVPTSTLHPPVAERMERERPLHSDLGDGCAWIVGEDGRGTGRAVGQLTGGQTKNWTVDSQISPAPDSLSQRNPSHMPERTVTSLVVKQTK